MWFGGLVSGTCVCQCLLNRHMLIIGIHARRGVFTGVKGSCIGASIVQVGHGADKRKRKLLLYCSLVSSLGGLRIRVWYIQCPRGAAKDFWRSSPRCNIKLHYDRFWHNCRRPTAARWR
jgi:hypothetical protein